MRNFLENNPAIALISACAVCIIATAAILDKFHENVLTKQSTEHENSIDKLESEISSIERGIPIDGPRSFNVASSVVDESKMLRLPSEFEDLIPNLVSVDPPELDEWTFSELNEISIHTLDFDDVCKNRKLVEIEEKELPPYIKPVFVWHRRESNSAYIKIPENSAFGECNHFRIFPSLTVYQIDSDWIKNNMKFFTLDLPAEKLSEDKVESLVNDPASMIHDPDVAFTYMNQENKFMSEFTGPFLFNKMYEVLTISTTIPEVDSRVMSIEKAESTLYFSNRYRYLASLDKDNLSERVPVVIDDEYFVISAGDSAVVVNITLPALEDHNKNFAWTQRWLSGLRVQLPSL